MSEQSKATELLRERTQSYYWQLDTMGWSLSKIFGPASEGFLQRLLTIDLKRLGAGEITRVFILNHRGRCECSFYLQRDEGESEAYWALCPPQQGEQLHALLERYHFGEALSWSQQDVALFMAHGEAASKLVSSASVFEPVSQLGAPHLGAESVSLALPLERVQELLSALADAQLSLAAREDWEQVRLIAGYPEAPSEYHEAHSPLDWGIDGISEGKGCYPGQEVIE
ncbi:MAG: hypothetical protein VYD19_07380, partial [Myxococcota bacterium]|nr:hypothetical protein [Myxococcota bacterium]